MSANFLPINAPAAPRPRLSGEASYYAVVMAIWLTLTLASLAAALCWRLLDSAPPMASALQVCGLAFFASGLLLLPAFEKMLMSQQRHLRGGALWPGQLASALLRLLLSALALALAPAPLLLAYSAREMVVRLDRINAPALLIPVPLVFLGSLAIGGTVFILLSCLLLHMLRRLLGLQVGSLIWLAALLLLNLPLLSGLAQPQIRGLLPWSARLSGSVSAMPFPGMQTVTSDLLPGPGEYLQYSLTTLANRDAALTSMSHFSYALLAGPALKIAVLLALLGVLLALPRPRPQIAARLLPLAFAAAGSVLAAAVLALLHALAWSSLPALRFPGNYIDILSIALLVALNIIWLLLRARECQRPGDSLLLLLAAPLAWTLLCLSAISADQASARELLAAGLSAWLLLCTLSLLLLRLQQLLGRLGEVRGLLLAIAALLLINLPPLGGDSLPLLLLRALAAALGSAAPPAWSLIAAALLALCSFALWPRRYRPKRAAVLQAAA